MDKRQLGEDLPRIRWIFRTMMTPTLAFPAIGWKLPQWKCSAIRTSANYFRSYLKAFFSSSFHPFSRFSKPTQKSTWCWSIARGESCSTTLWTETDCARQRAENSSDRCCLVAILVPCRTLSSIFSPALKLPCVADCCSCGIHSRSWLCSQRSQTREHPHRWRSPGERPKLKMELIFFVLSWNWSTLDYAPSPRVEWRRLCWRPAVEGGTYILSDFVVEPMSDFDQLPFVAQPMLRQSWSQAETTLGGFLNKN